MPVSTNDLSEFLYRALDSKFGIAILTSDVTTLRAKLYAARKAALNPAFEELAIKPSNSLPDSVLWIVRRSPQEPSNASS